MKVHLRDASWYSNPSTNGARYHWPSDRESALAACNSLTAICEEGMSPDEVPGVLRCGRPGCRARWAKYDAQDEGARR